VKHGGVDLRLATLDGDCVGMWDRVTIWRRRGDVGWAACDGGEAASVQ
jgi:hypothetical protein